MTEYSEPRLEHLYDMHVDLEPPQNVGKTPMGLRQIFILKGGTLEGPKLRGEVLPGGGDWATIRTDRSVQLDVRATARLDDGSLIYAAYPGIIYGPPEVMGRAVAGDDVPLSDYYFHVVPMFQTGAEQYDWLNRTVAVGRGKVLRAAVEYRVWAVS